MLNNMALKLKDVIEHYEYAERNRRKEREFKET